MLVTKKEMHEALQERIAIIIYDGEILEKDAILITEMYIEKDFNYTIN